MPIDCPPCSPSRPLATGDIDELDAAGAYPLAVSAATMVRSGTFADHRCQARTYFRSMGEAEQRHFVAAFALELIKIELLVVRRRMLGHLALIDQALCTGVEAALGMSGQATAVDSARWPLDLPTSSTLSLIAKLPMSLRNRRVGALVGDGCDGRLVATVRAALALEGADLAIIAPYLTGVTTNGGGMLAADHALGGTPPSSFDAVLVLASLGSVFALTQVATALDWVHDAFTNLKVIGYVLESEPLLEAAEVERDVGVIEVGNGGTATFIEAAKRGRIWGRETRQRVPA